MYVRSLCLTFIFSHSFCLRDLCFPLVASKYSFEKKVTRFWVEKVPTSVFCLWFSVCLDGILVIYGVTLCHLFVWCHNQHSLIQMWEISSTDCIDKIDLPENKLVQTSCWHVKLSKPEIPYYSNQVSDYEAYAASCKAEKNMGVEFARSTGNLEDSVADTVIIRIDNFWHDCLKRIWIWH